MSEILLSTTYLGSVQYYTKFLMYDKVYLEAHENYIKQTYRNRCIIYGANGSLTLSIPVTKKEVKSKTKDIHIDNSTDWQKMHWKSIESAYNSSPFFEFFEHELQSFYNKNYKFLLDLNLEMQDFILDSMELEVEIAKTEDYIHEPGILDFREVMNPKQQRNLPDESFIAKEYYQVFADKHGFKPNLSIIDLLFNEGGNAYSILKESCNKQ